jgi:hypothetical protein
MSAENDQEKCKIFYDVDRKEFNFNQFLFLYNQSKSHRKVFNFIFFLIAIVLLILLAENFNDLLKFSLLIMLEIAALVTVKLERWLMYYQVDEKRMKISKRLIFFGHQFKIFEKNLGEIEGFFKSQFVMAYFIKFKNSNKRAFFQYSEKNSRLDVVKYFTEELEIELKEVVKKTTPCI